MPTATAIIPARYGSTRFPGKALADRTGKPLIQHVYERATQAQSIQRVIVATDDQRIAEAVTRFGGEVAMTRADHPNGSSRVAEVAQHVDSEYIVNVQGDEPEIDPHLLDRTIETLQQHDDCVAGTIASPFASDENPDDPNIVKVVIDPSGRALYFSRSRIPHRRGESVHPLLKHIGVYIFRSTFLQQYVNLPATPLEQTEALEQLRILEHGHGVAVLIADAHFHGIDTPQQYDAFVARHMQREP